MAGISSTMKNSLVAQSLYGAQKSASNSMAKLASGQQIVGAADNVAALSIAKQMSGELAGMRAQQQNAAMSSAMLQVADGGLNQIGNMLERQQALAIQASSGALTNEQRGFLNQEFQSLSKEINRIAGNTNFNGINLLGGGNASLALAQTGTAANLGAANNTTFAANSTSPIQAFNTATGGSLQGNAGAGQLQFVDNNGNALTNFSNVNGAAVGNFDKFSISNVSYGTAATVTAEINGVKFSGVAANGATSVIVSDGGGTNIELSLSNFDLSSDATTSIAQAQLNADFADTSIQRTNTVAANFSKTALDGVTGGAMLRVGDSSASISNFQYAGNDGAANTNRLTVQVNGKTYTASGVSDTINNGDVVRFESAEGEALQLDFTGLNNSITNIRTNKGDQAGFVNALNEGFARTGSGAGNAGIGDGHNDIALQLGSARASTLYNGQTPDISTAAGAANALNVLGNALSQVSGLRANIGSQQSRVDFASAQLHDSIGNIESARAALEDTDYAKESTSLLAAQLKARMAAAVMAQGNKMGGNILNLLGG